MDDILQSCDILGVNERYIYQTASFVCKTLKFTSPVKEINQFFVFNKRSRRQILTIPTHRYKVGENCITYQGAKVWNSLPVGIRDINLAHYEFDSKLINWCLANRKKVFVWLNHVLYLFALILTYCY